MFLDLTTVFHLRQNVTKLRMKYWKGYGRKDT